DSDDAWIAAEPAVRLGSGAADTIGDGFTIAWTGGDAAIIANRERDLRFVVRDPAGRMAELQPSLGMLAHAVIMRDDGSVFIHLHPMGTVSPVLQRVFTLRDRGDTTATGRVRLDTLGAAASPVGMQMSGELSFPYAFPRAGHYLLLVQVKLGGRVRTATFTADVR